MRRLSFLVLLFWFSLVGCAAAGANAQQTEPPPTKNTTRVRQGGNVTAKMLIHKVQPEYPEEARQRRVEGTVRLHVIIARDGSIAQMEVISGDPLLVKSSLDAVRQWRYRPTLLKGEPVEVDTTIDVIYTLNR
jgi:periplasmic protein TonB